MGFKIFSGYGGEPDENGDYLCIEDEKGNVILDGCGCCESPKWRSLKEAQTFVDAANTCQGVTIKARDDGTMPTLRELVEVANGLRHAQMSPGANCNGVPLAVWRKRWDALLALFQIDQEKDNG